MNVDYREIKFNELSNHMIELLNGDISALLVKNAMLSEQSNIVYENFITSDGLYQRKDGTPALMVGANTYLKKVDSVIYEFQKKIYLLNCY